MEVADNIDIGLLNMPKIHSVSLSGMVINVDLKVDNPAKQQINLKIPSLRVYFKGTKIASTGISDKTYTINPVSSGKISGIKITLPFTSLVSVLPGIVTEVVKRISNLTDAAAYLTSTVMSGIGYDILVEANGIPLKVQKLS
jgi:hypothetical protein